MAQTIKLKRSNTAGNLPTTSNLELGEVGINTKDGKLFLRKHVDGNTSGDGILTYAPQGIHTHGTQVYTTKIMNFSFLFCIKLGGLCPPQIPPPYSVVAINL